VDGAVVRVLEQTAEPIVATNRGIQPGAHAAR
jgi:hypothetical protein